MSEFVSFKRSDLLQFFGKMALPPWKDRDGKSIGEHMDCAPIASEISEWIEEHQVTLGAGMFPAWD